MFHPWLHGTGLYSLDLGKRKKKTVSERPQRLSRPKLNKWHGVCGEISFSAPHIEAANKVRFNVLVINSKDEQKQ